MTNTIKRSAFPKLLPLLLGFCLALLLLLPLSPTAWADIAAGTMGECSWVIDDDGNLTVRPINGVSGALILPESQLGPWYDYRNQIKTAAFEPGVKLTGSARNLFNYCQQMSSVDLSGLDTSGCTDMSGMFYECSGLTSLDVSGFDTSNVANMSGMFKGCRKLTSLDVSSLDTANVTDMSSMFWDCRGLTTLDLSSFDTAKVTNMYHMFAGCDKLVSLDLSGFDTSSVTNMGYMFSNCSALTNLNVSQFDTSQVTKMRNMFYNCKRLKSLDLSGWDTSRVTDMYYMFGYCGQLRSVDVSGWDTSSVTNMGNMFYNCSGLTSLDVSGFDTSSVTYMDNMFFGCSGLKSLDVSGFDTSSVTYMDNMFFGCSGLKSLDVSGFDTSSVTNMGNMFSGCSGLKSLDVSGFDTSSVTNMSSVFLGCSRLTSLDVSGWDTSKVTTMRYMFSDCRNLTSLDVSGFDTANVTSMENMFSGCSGLTSLDVSGWNTANVMSMYYMFSNCGKLTSLDMSGWDTSKVTTMRYMFQHCNSLTSLDLSGWDTTKVTDMQGLFWGYFNELRAIALGEKTLASPNWSRSDLKQNWYKYAELSGKRVYNGEEVANLWDAQDYPGWYVVQGSSPPGDINLWAEFSSEEDDQDAYWVKDGNTWSYTFQVYDDSVPYWIWEDAVDGFSSEQTTPFLVEPDEDGKLPAVISILNTREDYETGSLQITKLVSGADRSFPFTVTLRGEGIGGAQKFGDVACLDGVGSFTLSNGQSVELTGLPVGTSYTVEETNGYGYVASWSGAAPSGTITEELKDLALLCTNTQPPPPPRQYVDFSVTKTVTGRVGNPDAFDFVFTASFTGLDAHGEYGYTAAGEAMSFSADASGNAYVTFTLKNNQSAAFRQIPEGATYQISEDGGDWTPSYTVTDAKGGSAIVSSGGSAASGSALNTAVETAEAGEAITVAYTNELDRSEDIRLKKLVETAEGEELPDESFAFTAVFEKLTPGAYYNSDIGTIRADVDGHAERQFSVKAGEEIVIYGLPVGASYRFTEEANPYVAAFLVTDANGGTAIAAPDGANGKSRVELSTGTETVDEGEAITVTFTNTPVELRDISVRKVWEDADDQDGFRPKSVSVQLLADGVAFGQPATLTRSTGWSYTWTKLDKLCDDGHEIVYSVAELDLAENKYRSGVTGDMESGFTITNTHEVELTELDGQKTWNDADDQDGIRPESVTVHLLANGEEVATMTTSQAENWSYHFEKLPVYQAGKPIVYTVKEDSVEGYTAAYDGLNVENTHEPALTEIEGRKLWDDGNNQDGVRPESVTVRLFADGKEIGTAVVSEKSDWSYRFTNLPKFRDGGVEIVYTVTEDAVSGYATSLDGYDFTNRHTPGQTSVSAAKIWDDENDRYGLRPREIELQLLADGENSGSPVTLSEENGWRYTWTELPEKSGGKTIVYTVKEAACENYSVEITGSAQTGFVLTNHCTLSYTSVSVTKVWDDKNNRDGLRPQEIEIQLLADGKKYGDPVKLSAANGWRHTWNDLSETNNGKPIIYTVKEAACKNYTLEITGSAQTGFVLTNRYTPGDSPKTGDSNDYLRLGVMGLLAMLGGALTVEERKRRRSAK